ncbi:MAG TPA: hypothetical protein VMS54_09205 [Vicinamibacterales bacterium]|nr:hypothetical protein [Vicinamibacterales bacterium]
MRRSLLLLAFVSTLLCGPLTGLASAQAAAEAVSETVTEDAVASKLFYAPTGRMMKRGDVYVAVDAFFIGAVHVGITDRFSIGVGRPLIPALNTTWITPKFQVYENDRAAVATGVLHLFAPGFGMGGVGYGVATIGSRDNAVTAGMGWFYGKDDDGMHVGTPVLIIGGEHRLTRGSKFITENYVFSHGAVLSAGARILKRNVSVEVGGTFLFIGNVAMPGMVVNFVFHPAARKPG